MREVQEVELMQINPLVNQQPDNPFKIDSNKRLFVAQKHQMENIQQVNLTRVQDSTDTKVKQVKEKFEYKDQNQAGSADDLMRIVASQQKEPKKKSTFAKMADQQNDDHVDQANQQENTMDSSSKRLKPKAEKGDSKR